MKDYTIKQVLAAKPGRHRVAASLYLYVAPDGRARRFIFRYTKPGTPRVTETGLGSFDVTSLAEARAKAAEYRRMVHQGIDPVEQRRELKVAATTFADVAREFMSVRKWRNRKAMELLLLERTGDLNDKPIAAITTQDVVAAVKPFWLKYPNQGRRVLSAISRVFYFAKAQGLRSDNPAEWRGTMEHLFPKANGIAKHFAALDYAQIPELVRDLHKLQKLDDSLSPYVIEFVLLTAARVSEVCGMRWGEVDLEAKVWTLPAERSKTVTEHRVPLCDRTVALLERQHEQRINDVVWLSRDGRRPIGNKALYICLTKRMGVKATIHGLRSSFRDWAGDTTPFARDHVEECLGHKVGNVVERAYRRSDALEKRRAILQAWAAFCGGAGQ
jgi:integrase